TIVAGLAGLCLLIVVAPMGAERRCTVRQEREVKNEKALRSCLLSPRFASSRFSFCASARQLRMEGLTGRLETGTSHRKKVLRRRSGRSPVRNCPVVDRLVRWPRLSRVAPWRPLCFLESAFICEICGSLVFS